ncbi:lysophospholipid acyltransferase family protein [Thalassotalea litorea]|uniref:lysophospholipid acyltransferase family protein n=1 Tax=Thalassotalea litorea TaxID=2020715 RepID=UPI0037351836
MKKNYFSYIWRLFTTAVCYTTFAIGAAVLALVIFPMQRLFWKDAEMRKSIARRTVHFAFKYFIGLMKYTGTSKFIIENENQLKGLKGHLILANHPSLIDVVVLISIVPNADCVVKAHLFRNPIMKHVLKSTGYISNADPEGLLNDCKRSLDLGNNLIIFPEGTRTTPGEKIKFLRGAANIALRCDAKLQTVLLKMEPSTLTKNEKWYKVPPRRMNFFLKPLSQSVELSGSVEDGLTKRCRSLTKQLENFFQEHLENYERIKN